MINSNSHALGIVFPNTYDAMIPSLTNVRLMASTPFASRYRMVDFILSSMSSCGIDNIAVMVNRNYHSLTDHLGSGREWDLVRKNGGLHIFPPYANNTAGSKPYTGRVSAIAGILDWLRRQKEQYVVISDANIAATFNFNKLLEAHQATGADVTIVYKKQEIPGEVLANMDHSKGFYYTLTQENGRVKNIYVNPKTEGVQNFSMNCYCISRQLLIDEINTAFVRGQEYFERDILLPQLGRLNVQAYEFQGYAARIMGLKSYYDESMKLLKDENLDALFANGPVYTKIRDDNPTRYIEGAIAKNVMVADGCVIEGDIEDSILFRGVVVEKGAKVKNCVLMQDTIVKAGADIEYVISDKDVTFTPYKEVKGTDSFPVYVAKGQTV